MTLPQMIEIVFDTILVIIVGTLVLGNLLSWVFLLMVMVISIIAVGYAMISQALRNARARIKRRG